MSHSPLHRPPRSPLRSLPRLRSLAGLRRLARPGLRGKASATAAACSAILLAGGLAAAALAAAPTAQAARAAHAAAAQAKAALSANWYESAPYYSTLDSNAPDVGQVMP